MKKNMLLAVVGLLLQGCTQYYQATYVGTLTGVQKQSSGKICDFGVVQIQPMKSIGADTVRINISDMTDEQEAELLKSLGKNIKIKANITNPFFGCNSSKLVVEEVQE